MPASRAQRPRRIAATAVADRCSAQVRRVWLEPRAPDHPVPRAALILLAPAREAMSQRPYRRPPERGRGRKPTSQQ